VNENRSVSTLTKPICFVQRSLRCSDPQGGPAAKRAKNRRLFAVFASFMGAARAKPVESHGSQGTELHTDRYLFSAYDSVFGLV
jgi:hypothetical protein